MDLIHFTTSEQKCADGVNFRVLRIKLLRIRADRLHMRQFSVGIHAMRQRRPGCSRRGSNRFRQRIIFRVQQTRAPQTIRLLTGQNLVGHFAELLDEAGPRRMIFRKILQHANQTAHDPAVAAARDRQL